VRTTAWILILAGCPPEPADIPCGDEIAIGTGTDTFRQLEDGDELGIIAGDQGGHHLLLAARVCTFDDPGLIHVVTRLEETGEIVSDVTFERIWLEDGDCCSVLLDIYAVLSAPATDTGYSYAPFDPTTVAGRVVTIELSVTDAAGVVHVDTVRITARGP